MPPARQNPEHRPVREALESQPGVLRRSAFRMVSTIALLVLVYALVPVAGRTDVGAVLLMFLGLVVFVALIVRQVTKIVNAEYPKLRAFEALTLVVPVLLLVFAYTYLSLGHSRPESFTEPLSRIDALYFSTTVFGTVGFGDIVATSQLARALVTIQILVGLIAAVGLAKLLLGAADLGLTTRSSTDPSPQHEPPRSGR